MERERERERKEDARDSSRKNSRLLVEVDKDTREKVGKRWKLFSRKNSFVCSRNSQKVTRKKR